MNTGHDVHRLPLPLLSLLLMMVCSVACGGEPLGMGGPTGADLSGGGGGDAGASFDCATYADAHCALIKRCAPFLDAHFFDGNSGACRARVLAQCLPFQSRIDGARGSACVASLQNVACDELDGAIPRAELALPAVCSTMGIGDSGDRCADGIVCHSGRCSRVVGNMNCGTCQPTVAKGGACAETTECDAGLRCVQGNQGKTCARPVALGKPCSASNACTGAATCVQGICTRYTLKGEKCDQNSQTAAFCNPLLGLGCDPHDNTCTEVLLTAVGQVCGWGCRVGYCDWMTNYCVAFPADDGSCADSKGGQNLTCQYGALCVSPDRICRSVRSAICQ